jgi:anti-sigma factor ChrR (cupin superfamily)
MTTRPDNQTPHDNVNRPDNREMDHPDEIDAALLHADCETIAALCDEIAATMPSPRRALKQRIMDAIAALPENVNKAEEEAPAPSHHFVIRAAEGEWNEALPGIRMKTLFVDPTSGRTTFMARLEPGAIYPDHRHQGFEEICVLEGDLVLNGTEIHPGDYSVSMADSLHHDIHSRNGCLCIVTSMMNDEMM